MFKNSTSQAKLFSSPNIIQVSTIKRSHQLHVFFPTVSIRSHALYNHSYLFSIFNPFQIVKTSKAEFLLTCYLLWASCWSLWLVSVFPVFAVQSAYIVTFTNPPEMLFHNVWPLCYEVKEELKKRMLCHVKTHVTLLHNAEGLHWILLKGMSCFGSSMSIVCSIREHLKKNIYIFYNCKSYTITTHTFS